MERAAHRPVTLEEAKRRFLTAAQTPGLVPFIKHRPLESMAAALILGLMLGASPGARKGLLPMILKLVRARLY